MLNSNISTGVDLTRKGIADPEGVSMIALGVVMLFDLDSDVWMMTNSVREATIHSEITVVLSSNGVNSGQETTMDSNWVVAIDSD